MSKHFGSVDREYVNLDFFLVVHPGASANWNRRPGVRVTAAAGKLDRMERAINLKVKLPLALFEQPTLSASITVDEPTRPIHLDTSAVADAVRAVIGMDVDIRVSHPEEPSDGPA